MVSARPQVEQTFDFPIPMLIYVNKLTGGSYASCLNQPGITIDMGACISLPVKCVTRIIQLFAISNSLFTVFQFRVVAVTFTFLSKKLLESFVRPYPSGQ